MTPLQFAFAILVMLVITAVHIAINWSLIKREYRLAQKERVKDEDF